MSGNKSRRGEYVAADDHGDTYNVVESVTYAERPDPFAVPDTDKHNHPHTHTHAYIDPDADAYRNAHFLRLASPVSHADSRCFTHTHGHEHTGGYEDSASGFQHVESGQHDRSHDHSAA